MNYSFSFYSSTFGRLKVSKMLCKLLYLFSKLIIIKKTLQATLQCCARRDNHRLMACDPDWTDNCFDMLWGYLRFFSLLTGITGLIGAAEQSIALVLAFVLVYHIGPDHMY